MESTVTQKMAVKGILPASVPAVKVIVKKKEEIRLILKEMLNFDTILNAEDTISLGFADEVFK